MTTADQESGPPASMPCPDWCTSDHSRRVALPSDDVYVPIFHEGTITQTVWMQRSDEWFKREGHRWRVTHRIRIRSESRDVLVFHSPHDLSRVLALQAIVDPAVLDAILKASDLLGWHLPTPT